MLRFTVFILVVVTSARVLGQTAQPNGRELALEILARCEASQAVLNYSRVHGSRVHSVTNSFGTMGGESTFTALRFGDAARNEINDGVQWIDSRQAIAFNFAQTGAGDPVVYLETFSGRERFVEVLRTTNPLGQLGYLSPHSKSGLLDLLKASPNLDARKTDDAHAVITADGADGHIEVELDLRRGGNIVKTTFARDGSSAMPASRATATIELMEIDGHWLPKRGVFEQVEGDAKSNAVIKSVIEVNEVELLSESSVRPAELEVDVPDGTRAFISGSGVPRDGVDREWRGGEVVLADAGAPVVDEQTARSLKSTWIVLASLGVLIAAIATALRFARKEPRAR